MDTLVYLLCDMDDKKLKNIGKKAKIKTPTVANKRRRGHSYFQSHECHIPTDRLSKYEIHSSKLCLYFYRLVMVTQTDPRARLMFRSYEALCAERYRQWKYYPFTIHPFSNLRFALEVLFVITLTTTNILVSIFYATTDPQKWPIFEKTIVVLESLYVVNIVMNFFTGYVTGTTSKHVILSLKSIIFRYLRTWFLIDVISLGFMETPGYANGDSITMWIVATTTVKVLRLPTLFHYTQNILVAFNVAILKKLYVEMFLYITMYLSWNVFFQYSIEYIYEGDFTPDNPRNCSWITIAQLWNASLSERYTYSVERAVGLLRGNSNLHLIYQDGCFEMFFVVSGLIAKLLILHCAFRYMIVKFGSESARAKYYMMTHQVHTYMDQRKFPPRIKKKILKFYAIRFQSHFFNEAKMMACVSGKLREDIIMHTGRQLVSDVKFLKNLPRALLLQIEMKLRIVVFIEGDIIIKFNTLGDGLYFIDKGTVAVYSESGKEVCHLDDGDFFGEIALVMKRRFRTASVVAVTNCELFRLNREDFESTIACYPTVYEDIKKVATHRYEKTCVLDEHHKSEMKKGWDSSDKTE